MKLRLLTALALMPFLGFSQWNISTLGETYQIDFDNNVPGVNQGVYQGNGFRDTSVASGQLNSGAWIYSGLTTAPNSITFGGVGESGQATKGISNGANGAMTTKDPGFYAFNTNNSGILAADYSMGWFSDAVALDPGTVTLRIQNNTGSDISVVRFAYDAKEYSQGPAETEVSVAYSFNNSSFTNVASLGHTTVKPNVAQEWRTYNKAGIISGVNWTNGSYLYIKWSSTYGTGSGFADAFAIDNISLRGYDVDFLWDGSTWSVGGEPSGSNTTSDALILPGTPANISSSTTLRNLFIESNAALDIDVDVTVSGAATLFADGNGYAQVVGEILGNTVYQSYRTTSEGRWFNVAIPIDATWADVTGIPVQTTVNPNTTNLWYYDANDTNVTLQDGTYKHITDKATAETELIGYQLYAGDGTDFGSGPFTLQVEGSVLDGPQSVVVYGASGGRFNYIPNPYPSTLDWGLVYADPNNSELGATYYVQDGEPDVGGFPTTIQYRTYNAIADSGTIGGTSNIAPGQAFFVTVDASSGGTLAFDNSHRNLTGNSSLFKTQATPGVIRLRTSYPAKGYIDETVIMFDAAQSDNFEPLKDGAKIMNGGVPNLYTRADNKDLVYNLLNDAFTTRTVDLYFQGDIAGTYEMSISSDALPADWTVVLEDKVTGIFTNLRKSNYTYSHAIAASTDRFVVHFNKTGAVGLDEPADAEVYSFVTGDVLTVNLDEITSANVAVFDVSGREMAKLPNQKGSINVDMSSWAKGVYLISVNANGKEVYQNKIVH